MPAFEDAPAVCHRPSPEPLEEGVGPPFLQTDFRLLHFYLRASVRSTSSPAYVVLVPQPSLY